MEAAFFVVDEALPAEAAFFAVDAAFLAAGAGSFSAAAAFSAGAFSAGAFSAAAFFAVEALLRAGAFLAAGASFSASAAGALPSAASFTGVSVFFFGITGLPFGYHDRSLTMTAGGGALPLLQRFPAPRAALYHNSLQIKSLVYV